MRKISVVAGILCKLLFGSNQVNVFWCFFFPSFVRTQCRQTRVTHPQLALKGGKKNKNKKTKQQESHGDVVSFFGLFVGCCRTISTSSISQSPSEIGKRRRGRRRTTTNEKCKTNQKNDVEPKGQWLLLFSLPFPQFSLFCFMTYYYAKFSRIPFSDLKFDFLRHSIRRVVSPQTERHIFNDTIFCVPFELINSNKQSILFLLVPS